MDKERVYENSSIRNTVDVITLSTIRSYPMIRGVEDDLKQELWLFLFERLSKYDAKKSSIESFAAMIIKIGCRRFLRKYFAQKNSAVRLAVRSSVPQPDMENQQNVENSFVHFDNIPQKIDHKILKSHLSSVDLLICQKLMEGKSIRCIAKEMEMKRSKIYSDHIHKMRSICKEIGIK